VSDLADQRDVDFGLLCWVLRFWIVVVKDIQHLLTAHPRHLAMVPAPGMIIALMIFIVAVTGVGADAGVPADSPGYGQRATLVLSVATTVSQGSLQHMGMCRMLESALQNRIDIEVGAVAMTLGWWSCVLLGGILAGGRSKARPMADRFFSFGSPPPDSKGGFGELRATRPWTACLLRACGG
jgi:hypothetical protein